MKKIFYFLFIVLLVLFIPAYVHANELSTIPSKAFRIVKHNQLYIYSGVQHKSIYFDADLLEEDTNDASTSQKEKLLNGKNAFTIISFVTPNFTNNSYSGISIADHFLDYSQLDFIYFRALRL